jgi:selenocysteine-specific elongation factor
VPGHERFVRTMVAGATGVDLFLLCVAADDGVMPQTREHVAVLRQLGVERGVVAVTKADLADPGRAAGEVEELLPGVEAVPVSAVRGVGLDDLLAALGRVADVLPGRAGGDGAARLHVDRSFTLKGIGTVVTGTLWSGALAAGDRVRILPEGLEARIRSVQVHDRPVERADAGQRVALNLSGVGWRDLGRGGVVCGPGAELEPTWLVDALVALEPGARPLGRGTRLHVHHGTREAPARVVPLDGDELAPGATGLAQLRLESPLVPAAGDRLVLRQLAPPDTIGGGAVVDPHPRKHGRRERPQAAAPAPSEPAPEPLELDDTALRLEADLVADGASPRTDADLAASLGLEPSAAADGLRALERSGRAVRVGPNLHFAAEPLAELSARVVAICERDGQATIAGVRDELGTSRKYAQALLEHLDAEKVTRRVGDAHALRRRGGAAG